MKKLFLIFIIILPQIKLHSQNLIWQKNFNLSGGQLFSICETNDSNLVMCGYFGISIDKEAKSFITKVNLEGNQIWSKSFSTIRDFQSVIETENGDLIFLGEGWMPIILKTNSEGDSIWSFKLDGAGGFSKMVKTNNGGVVVCNHDTTEFENNIFLTKISIEGQVEWQKKFTDSFGLNCQIISCFDSGNSPF